MQTPGRDRSAQEGCLASNEEVYDSESGELLVVLRCPAPAADFLIWEAGADLPVLVQKWTDRSEFHSAGHLLPWECGWTGH